MDGVVSIVHHSHHTRTKRQEPNSRLFYLPPALLSNMLTVHGVGEKAAAGCLASHLDVMSHLGKLSEQTGMPFALHRHG